MVAMPMYAAESSAEDADAEEPVISKDLGVIWSYGYQFEFKGSGANAIRWNFGDGSEELYDDFSDSVIDNDIWNPAHYFPDKGVYYITLTTYNDYMGGSETTSVYKLTVNGYPYVTLKYGNGEEDGLIQQTSGESNAVPAVKPADPEREGFTFTGWYTNSECTSAYDWSKDVTVPVTLYAGWEAIPTYDIDFDVGGGVPPMDSETVYENTEYTIPAYEGTNNGYTFGGWTWKGQTYIEGQKIIVTEDITFTAVWNVNSYSVTFETSGGTSIPAQTVDFNGTATKPATDPTKQHYDFAGWFVGDQEFDFNTPITGNTVITAHWTIKEYTVQFDAANGSDVDDRVVDALTTIDLPSTSRSGYSFQGWYNGSTYVGVAGDKFQVVGDVTLTAHWKSTGSDPGPSSKFYSVVFMVDGQPYESKTVEEGDTVSPIADPVKDGYVFIGWQINGQPYDFDTPVNDNIQLTAGFVVKSTSYTVTFDYGTGTVQKKVTAGNAVVPYKPVRDGYGLTGWTLNNQPYDFRTPVTSDITLVAQWEELPAVVKVPVDIGGGVMTPIDTTVSVGDEIRLPEATKEGQTLVGWDTDGDGQVDAYPGDRIVVDEDTTLTAIWKDAKGDQHKITIDNAPQLGFEEWFTDGNQELELPELETDDQKVVGWEVNGETYEPGEVIEITDDTTISAVWEDKETHTVTIETPEETIIAGGLPEDVYEGDIIVLPDASKEGSSLVGWDTNNDGRVDAYPGDEFVVTGDTVLKPVWEAVSEDEQVKVDFDAAGGDAGTDAWYTENGESMILPEVTDRPGFEFDGWYDENGNLIGMPGDEWYPTEDSTITGHWNAISNPDVKHRVTFEDGDGNAYRTVEVTEGRTVAQMKAPTKDGFEFVCWTLDGQPYDFRTPVMSDMTLVASWKPVHKVDVSLPDGAVVSGDIPSDVTQGDEVTLPDASKEGQTLVGWDTDNDGIADRQPGDSVVIDEDTVLNPVFEDLPEGSQQVKVEFGDVGGSDIPYDHWYTEDGRVTLPDADRDGQKLAGWDLDGDGKVDAQPGDTVDVPESGTVTAIWEDKQDVKVEVTVEEDVSLSGTVPETVKEGDEVVLPDASRPGQVLDGWDTDGDNIVDAYPGDTVVVDSDTVFKPIWSDAEGDQHKVVIDAAGGSAPYDEWYTVEGGSMVLPEPSKDGAGFQGWYTEDGDYVGMPGDTVYPDGDMKLVAHWDEGDDWVVYAVIVIAVVLVIVVVVVLVKKGAIPL